MRNLEVIPVLTTKLDPTKTLATAFLSQYLSWEPLHQNGGIQSPTSSFVP